MKKFALFAGLAAVATIGGVFAAWTFHNHVSTKELNEEKVAITANQDIDLVGLYGEATLTKKGDGGVQIVQAEEDSYKIALADAGEKESYTVTYDPVTDETTTKIKLVYTWTLIRNKEAITNKTVTKTLTLLNDQDPVSYDCPLALDVYNLSNIPDTEPGHVGDLDALRLWLGITGGETVQFFVQFSATITLVA